ncbi:hypothetical protein ACIO02_35390 [Streptomyces sp. NPDC087568]|uniref:hypothetical protein n=1 Tax=Streptomyces sp. NPDC087568 TaxID=3365799 RepID=UPI00380BA474
MNVRADRHPVPAHIPEQLREAYATTQGNPPPAHSPYQPGDLVQRHGYAGYPAPGPGRTGFRGWVVGHVGGTILTGITTAGEEWWEEWGVLNPDGKPVDMWDHCACCRTERRELLRAYYAKRQAQGQQLGLFAGEVAW